MTIRTVGVIGTGIIGASWTGLFLAHGLRVLVSDPTRNAESKLQTYLESIWPTLQNVGLAPNASLSNYRFVRASMQHYYSKLDFVQENAPKRLDLKTKLLSEINARTRPEVTIASSSSGIPSSQFIAQCAQALERVLIGHPFNPPHLMPLIKVVPHPKTTKASILATLSFYKSLGHECVTSSFRPRWAVTGPLMSNAMGGGGGSNGFKHLLKHLGPAAEEWIKDMKAHAFSWTPEQLTTLGDSVAEGLSTQSVHELERKRDATLVELFRLKSKMDSE
ncbi:hypothetical protein MY4038_010206 [Beauveria bassiana]